MEISTSECGKKDKKVEKVSTTTTMGTFMLEITRRVNLMAKQLNTLLMDKNLKDNSKTGSKMVKEWNILKTETSSKANTRTE